jgi:hypothetical protein
MIALVVVQCRVSALYICEVANVRYPADAHDLD